MSATRLNVLFKLQLVSLTPADSARDDPYWKVDIIDKLKGKPDATVLEQKPIADLCGLQLH